MRVFADDGGVGEFLAGGVFEFYDSGVGVVVGVVHLHGGLVVFDGERLGLESQGAVGECAVAAVEVFVDGAGVDEVLKCEVLPGFAVVGF